LIPKETVDKIIETSRIEEVVGDFFATAFVGFSPRAAFVREACVFNLDMRSLLDLKPINQPPPRGDMAQYLAEKLTRILMCRILGNTLMYTV
jgi:hypothetical protein